MIRNTIPANRQNALLVKRDSKQGDLRLRIALQSIWTTIPHSVYVKRFHFARFSEITEDIPAGRNPEFILCNSHGKNTVAPNRNTGNTSLFVAFLHIGFKDVAKVAAVEANKDVLVI